MNSLLGGAEDLAGLATAEPWQSLNSLNTDFLVMTAADADLHNIVSLREMF